MKKKVFIVPHTHFDVEVFLTKEVTLEIGYTNLLGALQQMREDHSYKFVIDQTSYIEPFLREYPEQREFFQEMVDSGRLEITGGMYIMPDVNMPSGESFIRQIQVGKEYCRGELGVDPVCAWTIDTFGHHPQMPQLFVKCGFNYAAFQRLMKKGSKSEFWWKGLDGSRLLTHWMPFSYASLYFAPTNEHEFMKYIEPRLEFLSAHAVTPNILAPAGADITPIEPHIGEMIKKYNGSQDNYELVIATPTEFFEAIRDEDVFQEVTDDLNPVFQGCYSARIEIKQLNRLLENQLVNWEKFDAFNTLLGGKTRSCDISRAWEPVLFNQFHDIICGCHVDDVFTNTMDRFTFSGEITSTGMETTLQDIAGRVDISGEGISVVVFNSLSWNRSDAVECKIAFSETDTFEVEVRDSNGNVVPSDLIYEERYDNGALRRATVLFIAQDVPSCGYEVYYVAKFSGQNIKTDISSSRPSRHRREDLNTGTIENEFYKLTFDYWKGIITSIVHKPTGWEVLPEDMPIGNMIVKEQDYGNFWQYNGPCKGDALSPTPELHPLPEFNENQADFAHNYLGDGIAYHGNAYAEMAISHPFGAGQFGTHVRLYAGLQRIDIRTTLENNDERVRYRAAFPTSIKDGKIVNEIPFGAIERPEGETPAQNWIDYGKNGKAVALLNRGLPGNNVVDGVMMLSLLKCTALKEGYAEVGGFKYSTSTETGYEKGKLHTFDYSLMPHEGDWRDAKVYRAGAEFNNPLMAVKPLKKSDNVKLPPRHSFAAVSADNVVISAVKDSDGCIMARVYEAQGKPGKNVKLELAWPIDGATETNLIEDDQPSSILPSNGVLEFDIDAFDIKTFKLKLE